MARRICWQLVWCIWAAAFLMQRQPRAEDLNISTGAALAKIHCQVCHLLPDPATYDKKTWEKHVLPWMSTKLGLRRVDLERLPGGKHLRPEQVYPAAPTVTSNQWKAICQYFLTTAPAVAPPQDGRPAIAMDLENQFTVVPAPFQLPTPMTTLLKIVPQQRSIFLGDSLRRALFKLDEQGARVREMAMGLPPVALQWQPDGIYVTLIGYVAPSDDPIGRCLFLPLAVEGTERPTVLLDHLPRPTDTKLADLNSDGRRDLVVCHYGNIVGRFSWYESLESGGYREHILRNEPGALCSYVVDFNQDGLPDLVVLMAQALEGIFLFTNLGNGQFKESTLVRHSPEWGYNYFELADFNRDGASDLLLVNGDNAEFPSPFKKYHGVRICLNQGNNQFKEDYFFPLNGAYKAVARDFDGDGDLDVACIGFFPDYQRSPEESFVFLRNEGGLQFTAHSFPAGTSGRWIVMDAADLDADGDEDIVLGAFNRGPETIPVPDPIRRSWQQNGPNLLILKNRAR